MLSLRFESPMNINLEDQLYNFYKIWSDEISVIWNTSLEILENTNKNYNQLYETDNVTSDGFI